MRRISKLVVVAVTGALALTATACGSKEDKTESAAGNPSPGGSSAAPINFKACMVTDTGGVDDRSFNASSWAGLQRAQKELGVQVKYVTSKTENDYVPNIDSLVADKCDLVIAVGGLMAKATGEAAGKHKEQKFAIVDSSSVEPNVHGMEYNTAEAAFLGGYLAAGMSKTGKVATFGGMNIPPVTVYMDGFQQGVEYYNQVKNKKVSVLGWNQAKQDGSIAGSFVDQAAGERIANDFMSQGADIILPVAGQTGLGAASAATKSNGKASIIWVDTDGYVSAPQFKSAFLSSVTKDISGAVFEAVKKASANQFSTAPYIGKLENNGVGLSPYHDFQSQVPQELTTEIDQLRQDIISGKIKITSPNQPKTGG